MAEFFNAVLSMFNEASFYLLIGFGVAGILRHVLSEDKFLRWFGKDNFGSVMLASILGVPLPLCSCSVLPVAVAMRKRGASRGAVTSFVISTPETGVDSIMLTYALLDPIMTVVRPVAAFFTALFAGTVVSWFGRKGMLDSDDQLAPLNGGDGEKNGESSDGGAATDDSPGCGCSCESSSADGGSCDGDSAGAPRGAKGYLFNILHYGYVTLPNDLVSVLCFAFVCSGLIAIAIPDTFFETPIAQGFPGMLIMLIVGVPFYICATASTPIAAMLMLKGLSPGAALVFLLAGPATNLGSIFALAKYLGKRTIAIYLACIGVVCLVLGSLVNRIYADYNVDVKEVVGSASEMMPSGLKIVCAILFGVLLVRAAWVTGMLPQWGRNIQKLCRPLHIDPLGRGVRLVVIVVGLGLYATTAFSVVTVGEVGWVLNFGKVTRTLDKPGLAIHLPWPVGEVKTCRPAAVRTIEFGFTRETAADPTDAAFFLKGEESRARDLEAEVMNAEENIVSVRFSVHYSVADPYLYTFRNAEPEAAVRAFGASTLREICSRLTTDAILVGQRSTLEARLAERLQAEADGAALGVKILKVTWVDVHAPPNVHYAFRDVASAGEDKHCKKLEADKVFNEQVTLAGGTAHRIVQEAETYASAKVLAARGAAAAFTNLAAAYKESPFVTRLRLYLETMESVLARSRTIVPLSEEIDVELWIKDTGGMPPFVDDADGGGADKSGADTTGRKNAPTPRRTFDPFGRTVLEDSRDAQSLDDKKESKNPFRDFKGGG